MAEYLDFEIEIGKGIGREYPIAVIRSPGGEARGQMVFPFDELALGSRLKDLQIALLRSGGQRRLLLTPQEQTGGSVPLTDRDPGAPSQSSAPAPAAITYDRRPSHGPPQPHDHLPAHLGHRPVQSALPVLHAAGGRAAEAP